MKTIQQAADDYIKSVQNRIKQHPYTDEELTDGFDVNDLADAFEEGANWATGWEQRRYEIAREILPYCCQASKEILLAGGKLEMEGITFADKVATQAVMFADALINKLKN